MTKLSMKLYNGRTDPNKDMDASGFDGPTLHGVVRVHFVYGVPHIHFSDEASATTATEKTGWEGIDGKLVVASMRDDMLSACGAFFGDWSLSPEEEIAAIDGVLITGFVYANIYPYKDGSDYVVCVHSNEPDAECNASDSAVYIAHPIPYNSVVKMPKSIEEDA